MGLISALPHYYCSYLVLQYARSTPEAPNPAEKRSLELPSCPI